MSRPLEVWGLDEDPAPADHGGGELPPADELDVKAKNKKLASLIVNTGGVTFLGYATVALLGLLGPLLQLPLSIFIWLKFTCLLTNMAWYWISANSEMREVTDKMFAKVYDTLLNALKN
jgi:hypothetical protein